MNIKKLNEELDKLLNEPLYEISDEKKQWAVDQRKAQLLAAQTALEKAQKRFDKTSGLKKALEPKTVEEVKTSLVSVGDALKEFGFTYTEPKQSGKDFIIVLSADEEITVDSEEALKKFLKDLSDKYGVKYSYKINKDNTVTITCEKPVIEPFGVNVVKLVRDKVTQKISNIPNIEVNISDRYEYQVSGYADHLKVITDDNEHNTVCFEMSDIYIDSNTYDNDIGLMLSIKNGKYYRSQYATEKGQRPNKTPEEITKEEVNKIINDYVYDFISRANAGLHFININSSDKGTDEVSRKPQEDTIGMFSFVDDYYDEDWFTNDIDMLPDNLNDVRCNGECCYAYYRPADGFMWITSGNTIQDLVEDIIIDIDSIDEFNDNTWHSFKIPTSIQNKIETDKKSLTIEEGREILKACTDEDYMEYAVIDLQEYRG